MTQPTGTPSSVIPRGVNPFATDRGLNARSGALGGTGAAQRVVGVELGRTLIRMVLLERGDGSTRRCLGVKEFPLEEGIVLGSAGYVQALRFGLQELCGRRQKPEIWASVTPDRSRIHQIQLPMGKSADMAQAVYWALQREESFATEATLFDFEVEVRAAGDGGGKLEASAIGYLMPREDAQSISRLFSLAGYPLFGLVLPINAIRNYFREGYIVAESGPVVFSHIGESTARISVVEGGLLALSRSIPVGLDTLAEALREDLKPRPSVEAAQQLVLGIGARTTGDALERDQRAMDAILPTIDRMARQIERTVEFFQNSSGKFGSIERVYFAGNLAANPCLTTALRNQLSLALELIDPFTYTEADDRVIVPEEPEERQGFATAFGLALSVPEITPNFLFTHQDRLRSRRHRWINQGIFLTFLLVVAGCGLYYGWQRSVLNHLREERAQIESQLAGAQPLIHESTIYSRMRALADEVTPLRNYLESQEAAALLAEIVALAPEAIRLQELSGRLDDADGRWVRISGWGFGDQALSELALAGYLSELRQSPLIAGAAILESRMVVEADQAPRRYFRVELNLDPPKEEVVP